MLDCWLSTLSIEKLEDLQTQIATTLMKARMGGTPQKHDFVQLLFEENITSPDESISLTMKDIFVIAEQLGLISIITGNEEEGIIDSISQDSITGKLTITLY